MKNKTILLVEDNFLNRRLSKKVLLENGYHVFEAKNAKEALEILKEEDITLAILDIHLGENEQDGISLGKQIKDQFSVPFIYLTAYENTDIIREAISTSPYSYLTKPFKNSDLIASVEIAIRQSFSTISPTQKIEVKDGEYNVELPIHDINLIESDGNYLLIHTTLKVFKKRATINQIIEDLPQATFVRVHRAYIVNKQKIVAYTTKNVIIGNHTIPISNTYIEDVRLLIQK
jgi:DNA-binding LytR/AlgR family response regulator